MSELVANCPRCGAQRITFDVLAAITVAEHYGWQKWYEVFAICRHCQRSTTFVLSENVNSDYQYFHKKGILNIEQALNDYVTVEKHVQLRDEATVAPPEHVPAQIAEAFREGATCLASDCYNAAGTMFRLCIDIATRGMLPKEDVEGLNSKTRRDLGLRLPWLIAKGLIPESLRELSSCIKEDGNDGAHAGNLSREDAEDLLDFTVALLERLFTEPEKLRLAKDRRTDRRGKK